MTFFAAAIGVVKSAKLAEIPTITLFTIARLLLIPCNKYLTYAIRLIERIVTNSSAAVG